MFERKHEDTNSNYWQSMLVDHCHCFSYSERNFVCLLVMPPPPPPPSSSTINANKHPIIPVHEDESSISSASSIVIGDKITIDSCNKKASFNVDTGGGAASTAVEVVDLAEITHHSLHDKNYERLLAENRKLSNQVHVSYYGIVCTNQRNLWKH